MERPVICQECTEEVELHSCKESPINNKLICPECYYKHDKANDYADEAKVIQLDLDNKEDYMKGDRRGWKNNIKQLKLKIKELGFEPDDLI